MFRPPPAAASATVRNILVPTFWAADASFSPDLRAARAISSQPNRHSSWPSFSTGTFGQCNKEESDHEEDQINVLYCTGHWRSLRRNCFSAAVAERCQGLCHLWRRLQRHQTLPHGLPLYRPHGNGQSVLFIAPNTRRIRLEVAGRGSPFIRICN